MPISNGVVTFKAGQATNTIPVTIPASTQPTGNETFTVTLSDCNPGAVPAGPTTTVTIIGASASGPALEVAPSTLDFGSVAEGVTESRTFTVTNTGGSPDTIATSNPPSDGQGFAASAGLAGGNVITPGQSVTETVSFTPTAQGPLSDSWTFAGSDGLGAQTVSFVGTGLGPLTDPLGELAQRGPPATGTTAANFVLSLSEPSPRPGPATVTVRTLDGTCTAASGAYVPITSQLVTFAPGPPRRPGAGHRRNGSTANHCYFGLRDPRPRAGWSSPMTTDGPMWRPTDVAHDLVYTGDRHGRADLDRAADRRLQ